MPSKVPARYENIVYTAAKGAAAVGVGGAMPVVGAAIDITGMTGIWGTMLTAIAEKAGRPVDSSFVSNFIGAFAKGAAAYIGGSIVMRQALHFLPGIGTMSLMGINAAFNATYTYKFGCQLIAYFEKPNFEADDLFDFVDDILRAVTPSVSDIVGTVKALSKW